MRITHLTQIIRGHGGVQRLLREVVRRQAERGHEVHLIAIGSSDLQEDLHLGAEVSVSWFTTRRIAGRVPYQAGLLRRIRAAARQPGIFHAHQHFAPPTLLAATTRAPKVMTPYLHVQHDDHRLHAARRGLELRVVADRYRGGLVFLCDSERRAFETLAHRRYSDAAVVPPGIGEPDRAVEAYATRGPVVLVVARLVRSKQVDRVIAAVAASTGGARLVVVGTGPEWGALDATCRAHGLDPATTLLGPVDDESLQRWYQTADVVISLSREESFGLTLLEAASAGAALLVSDLPAHRDALMVSEPDDHALVPVDAATDRVAEALDRLLTRPERPTARRRPFRTWDDTVDELEDVYRRVLARQR